MNINYEILFWIMLVVNLIGLAYLISLVRAVNDLSMRIDVKLKTIIKDIVEGVDEANDIIRKVYGNTKLIRNDIDDVFNILEEIAPEEDDCEEEEAPEEDLKPGEVATLGEITIEIDEDPIHLITQNQYFFEQGHDKFDMEYDPVFGNLYFHFGLDGDYIIVDNVEECIGTGLKYFGVNSKDDDVVYIRNNIFKADFMIKKVSVS